MNVCWKPKSHMRRIRPVAMRRFTYTSKQTRDVIASFEENFDL